MKVYTTKKNCEIKDPSKAASIKSAAASQKSGALSNAGRAIMEERKMAVDQMS